MKRIVAEVEGEVPVAIETVFDVFVPIDLTTIMTGYGPLPSVVAIEDQSADWGEIGESRIIRLADGGGMLETLTAVERPRHFAYTINELTNALRFLVSEFHGAWFFEKTEEKSEEKSEEPAQKSSIGRAGQTGGTRARWRYEFVARSFLAWPLAWLVVTRFWRPYMRQALGLASAQAVARAGRGS